MTTPEMHRERSLEKALSDALARASIAEMNVNETLRRIETIKEYVRAAQVLLGKCDG